MMLGWALYIMDRDITVGTATRYGWTVLYIMDRDIAVGTATRYRLDGPGNESRLGARYSTPVQTGPGTCLASCTMGIRSLSRG